MPSKKLAGESGLSFYKAFQISTSRIWIKKILKKHPKQQHCSHWQGAKWVEISCNDVYIYNDINIYINDIVCIYNLKKKLTQHVKVLPCCCCLLPSLNLEMRPFLFLPDWCYFHLFFGEICSANWPIGCTTLFHPLFFKRYFHQGNEFMKAPRPSIESIKQLVSSLGIFKKWIPSTRRGAWPKDPCLGCWGCCP